MLKKTIKFEDLEGNEIEEDFYFHLSKADLVEMEITKKDGFVESMKKIIEADDREQIVAEFKKLLLSSYGKKSDDGRRFIKSEELTREFQQTDAYSQFFVELATDPQAATEFVNGVVPKNLSKLMEESEAVEDDDLPQGRPVEDVELPEPELPTDPKNMTHEELLAAFNAKVKAAQE